MAKQKGRRYNYIYSKLVTQENGLTGFVAYCLYKQEKIQWIEEFRKTHNNIPPTDKEIEDGFSKTTDTPNYMQGLIAKAITQKEELLTAWTLEHENEKKNLREENEKLKTLIKESVKKYLSPNWKTRFKDFFKDILFSLISLLLWFGIIVGISNLMPPFKKYVVNELRGLIDYKIPEGNE